MKKVLKILAVLVVLVLAGTYVIYALEYKGNYNLTAQVTLNVDENGGISLTEFASDSTPTDMVQFWDLFKGSADDIGDSTYKVYFELNQSGEITTKTVRRTMANGESQDVFSQFKNMPIGNAVLKITVRDGTLDTHLFEKSYSVVIG